MLRTLRPADLPAVAKIWLAGNLSAHAFIPASYWQSKLGAVTQAIAAAEVWVYADIDTPLGFIGLRDDYIAGLFVAEACRSRGIGRLLLNKAKAIHPTLSLDVYRKNNRALAFYRREGFRQISSGQEPETKETACRMLWP